MGRAVGRGGGRLGGWLSARDFFRGFDLDLRVGFEVSLNEKICGIFHASYDAGSWWFQLGFHTEFFQAQNPGMMMPN